jgi:RNA polymerase sigma factor (sigma-70 family)
MAAGPDVLLRYIYRLGVRPEPDEATGAALLRRFISEGDDRAFTALVDRHGPLVLRVCRRVLGAGEDAEDAFQATFLVLARKAATLRHREALSAWLHGVARRVALKARSARARQSHWWAESIPFDRPLPVVDPRPDPLAEFSGRELVMIIDEEVQRLPEAYRLPVLLCCLEGHSLEEAARRLGWTAGSVKGRLERGRARLHDRLLRRGLTLSAALAAAEVSRGAAAAAVVARLAAATTRGALLFAVRPEATTGEASAAAVALAAQTLKGMAVARLKLAAALVLVTVLLTTGWMMLRAGSKPDPDQQAQARSAPVAGSPPGELPRDPDAPIEVSGRVLDARDRPIAGARLYVGFSAQGSAPELRFQPMAYRPRTTSGTDGQFRFTFAQSELDAVWLDHSRPAVIAVAQGYGPGWAAIKGSPADGQLSLKLADDFPIEGRVHGRDQQPIAGARVRVWEVAEGSEEAMAQVFQGQACLATGKGCRGPLPEQPPFVTTTADGRFRLTGLGRDRVVALVLEGPDVQHTLVWAATRPRPEARSPEQLSLARFDYPAPVSRRIRGVVRDKATGRPVAAVKVSARPGNTLGRYDTSLTDSAGGYEILVSPRPAGWVVQAQPEGGQPYFAASVLVPDYSGLPALCASATLGLLASPQGQGPFLAACAVFPRRADTPATDAIVVDFDLMSGIRLRGRVTDRATGKPPMRAVVEYYPLFPNPHGSGLTNAPEAAASSCLVRPDGSYDLAVLPGPGVVCAAASPRRWYAAATTDEKELTTVADSRISPDGSRLLRIAWAADRQGYLAVNRYNVLSPIHPREGTTLPALDLSLPRAQPIESPAPGPPGR